MWLIFVCERFAWIKNCVPYGCLHILSTIALQAWLRRRRRCIVVLREENMCLPHSIDSDLRKMTLFVVTHPAVVW